MNQDLYDNFEEDIYSACKYCLKQMNMYSSLQIVLMLGSYACIDLTMDACLCRQCTKQDVEIVYEESCYISYKPFGLIERTGSFGLKNTNGSHSFSNGKD